MLTIAVVWAGEDERAQDLFHQRRWFDLREVHVTDRYAAALIKGAVASAFNRPAEAERELKLAIHLTKSTEQGNTAREKLAVLYLRQGRSREAAAQMRAALKRDPARSDLQGLLDLFGPLAGAQPFSAKLPKGGADIACEVTPQGITVGATVNGKNVNWLLDTGANFSTVGEAEARQLGIAVRGGGGVASDLAGVDAKTQSGIIDLLRIGAIELRNLPVLISPENQRGLYGLPVALALQSFSWTRDGKCRAAFPAIESGAANLMLDDFNAIVRTAFETRPLELMLDTGRQSETQLWSRFKVDFPSVELHHFTFEIGGFRALLVPARLFPKPVGNEFQHGLLGMDVLSQPAEVLVDFRTMTLTAR